MAILSPSQKRALIVIRQAGGSILTGQKGVWLTTLKDLKRRGLVKVDHNGEWSMTAKASEHSGVRTGKQNPKGRTTLLPAKVRVNPKTGKVQVFVTPKVAAQVKNPGIRPPNGSASRIPVTLRYLVTPETGSPQPTTTKSEALRIQKAYRLRRIKSTIKKLPKDATTWNY